MFEQKKSNDDNKNELNNEDKLKVVSSKKNDDHPIYYKDLNIESDLKPIYHYECENCKKVFHDETQLCDNCGSKYIRKVDSGLRGCYIYSKGKRLIPKSKKSKKAVFVFFILLMATGIIFDSKILSLRISAFLSLLHI